MKELHIRIFTNIVKALIFILPALYGLYTVIKTKNKLEKVDSIANRLVVFSSSLSHKGTNSTNCKNRMVINFNYIK